MIETTGGLAGIRHYGLLASPLVAPQTLWHYASKRPTLVDLAAKLAYGLAKNNGFVDGNKRTAFIGAYTFLVMNGIVIHASRETVIEAMEALVSSTDESGQAQARFSYWLSSVTEAAAEERL